MRDKLSMIRAIHFSPFAANQTTDFRLRRKMFDTCFFALAKCELLVRFMFHDKNVQIFVECRSPSVAVACFWLILNELSSYV